MVDRIRTTDLAHLPDECWPLEEDLMLGRRHVREAFVRSDAYNIEQFRFWYGQLEALALSCFEWEGMPAGIDARAVEFILLHFGMGCLFMEDGGHLFAQAAPADNINMYYNPNEVLLTTPNGLQWHRHCQSWVLDGNVMPRDAALCYDSLLRRPVVPRMRYYARRLANIDRIIDVNVEAQRTPWMLRGEEESKGNVKRVADRLLSNDQFIPVNSKAPAGFGVEVLQTNAPYVAGDLKVLQGRIVNEFATFLGIDNANTEKRERLIDREVSANDEQIMLNRRSRLAARLDFCEKCRDVFGLDVRVSWAIPHMRAELGDTGANDALD